MTRASYEAAFAYHFGIRPWEYPLLNAGQIRRLKRAVDDMNEE